MWEPPMKRRNMGPASNYNPWEHSSKLELPNGVTHWCICKMICPSCGEASRRLVIQSTSHIRYKQNPCPHKCGLFFGAFRKSIVNRSNSRYIHHKPQFCSCYTATQRSHLRETSATNWPIPKATCHPAIPCQAAELEDGRRPGGDGISENSSCRTWLGNALLQWSWSRENRQSQSGQSLDKPPERFHRGYHW